MAVSIDVAVLLLSETVVVAMLLLSETVVVAMLLLSETVVVAMLLSSVVGAMEASRMTVNTHEIDNFYLECA